MRVKNKEDVHSNGGICNIYIYIYISLPWVHDNHKETGKNENFKPGPFTYM